MYRAFHFNSPEWGCPSQPTFPMKSLNDGRGAVGRYPIDCYGCQYLIGLRSIESQSAVCAIDQQHPATRGDSMNMGSLPHPEALDDGGAPHSGNDAILTRLAV